MGDRDIKWVCSCCGAVFLTREALAAHTAAGHEGYGPRNAPRQDSAKPGAALSESARPPNGPPQTGSVIARRSGPDAIAAASSEEPAADATAADRGGMPSESTRSQDAVNPSVTEEAPEVSARDPQPPHAVLARLPEVTSSIGAASEEPTAAPAIERHRHSPTSPSRALGWLAVAAICIVAAGLVVAFPRQIAHQIALSVTRQPQPFTELYFSNAKSLPRSLSFSRPNVFGFTVVNHEARDTTYSYVVTLASLYGSSTIAQGRVDLRNNKGATTVVHVSPTRRATKYLITVSLLGRAENVWFRAVSH